MADGPTADDAPRTKLVIKGGERRLVAVPEPTAEYEVDPPEPGGYMVAVEQRYRKDDLLSWYNYVSPPRGWPQAFTYFAPMKEFIQKELAGKRVRLTLPPHPMEIARSSKWGLRDGDALGNAIIARRELGWDIIGGFALLELAQGCARDDPISEAFYHGERCATHRPEREGGREGERDLSAHAAHEPPPHPPNPRARTLQALVERDVPRDVGRLHSAALDAPASQEARVGRILQDAGAQQDRTRCTATPCTFPSVHC